MVTYKTEVLFSKATPLSLKRVIKARSKISEAGEFISVLPQLQRNLSVNWANLEEWVLA